MRRDYGVAYNHYCHREVPLLLRMRRGDGTHNNLSNVRYMHVRSIFEKVIATDQLRDRLQKSLMVRVPLTNSGMHLDLEQIRFCS